ncbi:hypothetical protein GPECTOR_1049g325 [Gonium pectorale]|uniref:Uncharacterized protein n=1 Tax=Gonium pectorale TaxID=33097 RepID=A0A150FUX3_GONPE|nr:hypothetical protein GPECTOR_1049g325 [Gonium pectorale]|eukprot:KXZ40985.1 hypothetical protein GPECTOR_1049g325 [Gonium pectorale]
MINLLEILGGTLDRELIESVYQACGAFEPALERLMEMAATAGLGMRGIMSMVSGHPNARAVSLRQWASSPLSDSDFTALVVALSTGSRSERRAVPVEALSFKGCRWLSDGHVMSLCHTMQHLKEVDLTDCVGVTDAGMRAAGRGGGGTAWPGSPRNQTVG